MRSAKFSHSSDLFVSARFKTGVFAINTRDTNMRPKKRDQPVVDEPKSQVDQAQADHELFLQAFESKHVYFLSSVSLCLGSGSALQPQAAQAQLPIDDLFSRWLR